MIAWIAVLKTNQYWKRASRGLHKENIPNSSLSHNTGTKTRTDEISKWMNLGFEFFNCCPQNKDPFLFSHLKHDPHQCSSSSLQYRICTCISMTTSYKSVEKALVKSKLHAPNLNKSKQTNIGITCKCVLLTSSWLVLDY